MAFNGIYTLCYGGLVLQVQDEATKLQKIKIKKYYFLNNFLNYNACSVKNSLFFTGKQNWQIKSIVNVKICIDKNHVMCYIITQTIRVLK